MRRLGQRADALSSSQADHIGKGEDFSSFLQKYSCLASELSNSRGQYGHFNLATECEPVRIALRTLHVAHIRSITIKCTVSTKRRQMLLLFF